MQLPKVPVERVSKLARSAVRDGNNHKALRVLARFGKAGSNTERNLHRWAKGWMPMQPYDMKLPLAGDSALGTQLETVYVMLPHEFFSAMCWVRSLSAQLSMQRVFEFVPSWHLVFECAS